jgi:hypothetical protein
MFRQDVKLFKLSLAQGGFPNPLSLGCFPRTEIDYNKGFFDLKNLGGYRFMTVRMAHPTLETNDFWGRQLSPIHQFPL